MTTQEKIDRIYEVIADKTLDFGCILTDKLHRFFWDPQPIDCEIAYNWSPWEEDEDDVYIIHYRGNPWYYEKEKNIRDESRYKIKWSPVMIWDVLEYLNMHHTSYGKLISMRDFPAKPIEEQTEECIDFIYWLLWIQ